MMLFFHQHHSLPPVFGYKVAYFIKPVKNISGSKVNKRDFIKQLGIYEKIKLRISKRRQ